MGRSLSEVVLEGTAVLKVVVVLEGTAVLKVVVVLEGTAVLKVVVVLEGTAVLKEVVADQNLVLKLVAARNQTQKWVGLQLHGPSSSEGV